jgi:hypothetical protein
MNSRLVKRQCVMNGLSFDDSPLRMPAVDVRVFTHHALSLYEDEDASEKRE